MAEQSEYPLTHSPPENTELALLIAYIDQRVPEPELRHKDRMFTLLQANGLIARSNVEQQFLSRKLRSQDTTPQLIRSRSAVYLRAAKGRLWRLWTKPSNRYCQPRNPLRR
jgi:hypothetical protein